MKVSIAQARKDLSQILKRSHQTPVIVTRRGEPDAVILSFQEYEHLRRLQAYLRMMRLSRQLENCGMTATQLYEASRRELERCPELATSTGSVLGLSGVEGPVEGEKP